MLLDHASDTQMRAAGLVMGATMVAFLGAQWLPRYSQAIRLVVAGVYCAAVLGFLLYYLL